MSDFTQFLPSHSHFDLGSHLYDSVDSPSLGRLKCRFWNTRAAKTVGLDALTDSDIEQHFGRFAPFPGSFDKPLALRYHGHQFQVYNPDIGDGRGFLYAQCREKTSPRRLLDFGTKGTGTTPYSRSGDGKLTLKGAVRELLATTMLAAQGVPTSRTFGIFEDMDAQLYRGDEPSPARGAVLTRLSHSHIRFGTFQYLAFHQNAEDMERLVRYCLNSYFNIPEKNLSTTDATQIFFQEVVRRKTLTVAAWMMAGFVHGVLNTDNMNITGESFDYGPWRWAPTYDGTFTAAYFDHQGLYAFGRQPQAVFWNLQALASALTLIHPDTEPLLEHLKGYSPQLQSATIAQFFWRMGLTLSGDEAADGAFAEACLKHLKNDQSPFEDLFYASVSGQRELLSVDLQDLIPVRAGTPAPQEKETMLIEEVELIWAAIADHDDWEPLNNKLRRLDHLYDTRRAWEAPSVQHMEAPQ